MVAPRDPSSQSAAAHRRAPRGCAAGRRGTRWIARPPATVARPAAAAAAWTPCSTAALPVVHSGRAQTAIGALFSKY
eukprot:6964153-Prymnesium_polylepis.1